jgi:hypothetical protein
VRFSDRIVKQAEEKALNELQKAKKECIDVRKGSQLMKVVQEHEAVYCNKRKSYTRN